MECKTCKKVFTLKRAEIGIYCSEECRQLAYRRVNNDFWRIEFTEFDEFVKMATDYYYRCGYISRSSSIWASWVDKKIKDGKLKGVPNIDDFFQGYLQWLSDAWSKRKEQEKSCMFKTMRERGSQYWLELSERHKKDEKVAGQYKPSFQTDIDPDDFEYWQWYSSL